jgi:hypothetical protein
MSQKLLTLMSLTMVLASTGHAAFEDQDQAAVKVYNLRGNTVVENTSSKYFMAMNQESWGLGYIVKAKTKTVSNLALDGSDENSEITVFKMGKDGTKITGARLWSKTVLGGDVTEKWGAVAATESGCCAEPNLTSLYSMEKGQVVLKYYNDEIFHITIPNQKSMAPRFVAAIPENRKSTRDASLANLTTLAYVDQNGTVLDKIYLYVQLPPGWGTDLNDFGAVDFGTQGKTQVRNSEVELWASDGKSSIEAMSGVAFKGEYYYGNKNVKFLIPIEGNKFNLEKAQLSPELTIER